jgi:hypothetical protein
MTNRITTIMNVITEEKLTYFNSLSLDENMISAIITTTEDSRKLLNSEYREKISVVAKLERIQSKNGQMKVYSPSYDMIAFTNN